jgi:23S rRNA pseudouridine2605 synthase
MPARTDNFQKFVKQKKGSAIKEEIKQQKKKEKKERSAAIEAHFEKKRAEREQRQQGIRPTPTPATTTQSGRPNKYPKKDAEQTEAKAAPVRAIKELRHLQRHQRRKAKNSAERPSAKTDKGPKAHCRIDKTGNTTGKFTGKKVVRRANSDKKTSTAPVTTAVKASRNSVETDAPRSAKNSKASTGTAKRSEQKDFKRSDKETGESMPLNKFVAHGGICSRRDAAILVKEGKVTVNGTVATDPGMKVSVADTIKVNNKNIIPSKNFV